MKNRFPHLAVFAAIVLASLAGAAPAHAAADLEITALSVQGTARVGTCNTLSMTVRNHGDAFTESASLDIKAITFPSGSPLLNRVEKNLLIGPLQPGAQVTFAVADVEFKSAGPATVQAVVDFTSEIPESNENNNFKTLTTTVSGSCTQQPTNPGPTTGPGCDLSLVFTAPAGSSVPAGAATYTVRAKNEGIGDCESTKLRLYRYNGSNAGGYGSAVGGTRAIWTIPALRPGASVDHDFVDRTTKGVYTYATKFLGPWNDADNSNHLPKKTVKVQ